MDRTKKNAHQVALALASDHQKIIERKGDAVLPPWHAIGPSIHSTYMMLTLWPISTLTFCTVLEDLLEGPLIPLQHDKGLG